jgi:uncharacterized protein (TIGR00255 family)
MNSMTGYGSSRLKNHRLEIETHVKSVNGRFLEIRFHLPKEYSPYENDFRKIFTPGWARGTVDVYVHRRVLGGTGLPPVQLRTDHALYWLKRLRRLAKELDLKAEVSLPNVLQMPMVLESTDRSSLLAGELKFVAQEIQCAADECQRVRAREGSVLKKELQAQMKNLQACVPQLEEWRAEAFKNTQERLKSRLSSPETEGLDKSRLALEIALILDKMDIREEIVRLKEHVAACRDLITESTGADKSRGKKLDFYGQELLREVNTIGSKSQLASLTKVVISAKSIIENFREQVQNIE